MADHERALGLFTWAVPSSCCSSWEPHLLLTPAHSNAQDDQVRALVDLLGLAPTATSEWPTVDGRLMHAIIEDHPGPDNPHHVSLEAERLGPFLSFTTKCDWAHGAVHHKRVWLHISLALLNPEENLADYAKKNADQTWSGRIGVRIINTREVADLLANSGLD